MRILVTARTRRIGRLVRPMACDLVRYRASNGVGAIAAPPQGVPLFFFFFFFSFVSISLFSFLRFVPPIPANLLFSFRFVLLLFCLFFFPSRHPPRPSRLPDAPFTAKYFFLIEEIEEIFHWSCTITFLRTPFKKNKSFSSCFFHFTFNLALEEIQRNSSSTTRKRKMNWKNEPNSILKLESYSIKNRKGKRFPWLMSVIFPSLCAERDENFSARSDQLRKTKTKHSRRNEKPATTVAENDFISFFFILFLLSHSDCRLFRGTQFSKKKPVTFSIF